MAGPYDRKNNGDRMETQWDRIVRLKTRAGISNRRLATDLGYSHSNWRHWVDRDDLPKELLVKIARYFRETHGIDTTWEWVRDGERSNFPKPLNNMIMRDVLRAIRIVCEEEGITPDDETAADLASNIYPVAQQAGAVDMDWVRSQVRLAAKYKR